MDQITKQLESEKLEVGDTQNLPLGAENTDKSKSGSQMNSNKVNDNLHYSFLIFITYYFLNAVRLLLLNQLLMLFYGSKKSEMLELEKRGAIGLFFLKYLYFLCLLMSLLIHTYCLFQHNRDLNHFQVKY